MGMIRCPVHGLVFMEFCCAHVADAIENQRLEHSYVFVDSVDASVLLCDVCRPKAVRQIASGEEWFTVTLELDVPIVPVCGDHAEEWYAIAGMGDLTEAYNHAKGTGREP